MVIPRECYCFDFCFGTACDAIMFVVAIGTTISCSLGRHYRPIAQSICLICLCPHTILAILNVITLFALKSDLGVEQTGQRKYSPWMSVVLLFGAKAY